MRLLRGLLGDKRSRKLRESAAVLKREFAAGRADPGEDGEDADAQTESPKTIVHRDVTASPEDE